MRTAWELPLRKSRVVVMTSYADGSPVQAGDTIRKEQADALLTSRLERGGGIPMPMVWSCSSAAVYAVPGWQSVPPQADSAGSGSYQDATATKPVSLGASICGAQSCGLASDWLPKVGVGIRVTWNLSPNCLGSGDWSHQCLEA
jgi:hypothetical protein